MVNTTDVYDCEDGRCLGVKFTVGGGQYQVSHGQSYLGIRRLLEDNGIEAGLGAEDPLYTKLRRIDGMIYHEVKELDEQIDSYKQRIHDSPSLQRLFSRGLEDMERERALLNLGAIRLLEEQQWTKKQTKK